MSFLRVQLRAWWPALLWMLAIYVGSTDVLSSQHTSRFIGPFLRWLMPDISDTAIHTVQFMVRKCGHLSEYAVLAILFQRALRLASGAGGNWNWRTAGLAFSLAAAYAMTDEFHQWFVVTRYGSVVDVLIDIAGAAFGLGALWLWHWRFSQGRMRSTGNSVGVPRLGGV